MQQMTTFPLVLTTQVNHIQFNNIYKKEVQQIKLVILMVQIIFQNEN